MKAGMGMLKNNAQGVAEYSVCLALVVAALFGMQVYVKRGLQGRYKQVVDHTAKSASSPRQYEPYYLQDDTYTIGTDKKAVENTISRGEMTRDLQKDSVTVTGKILRRP